MAPNKKPSAFMSFTMEWKGKYGKHMDMRAATEAAGKVWEKMSQDERSKYNAKAKIDFQSPTERDRLTCTGHSIKGIEAEKQHAEVTRRDMQRDIETIIKRALKNFVLEDQKFYFMMVNYFAKSWQNHVYIPAELAIAEFSLKDGVTRKYHTFINPRVNIYGQLYEAQQHADTTHQLPLPPNAMGTENLTSVYNAVVEFIQDKQTDNFAPVYTDRDNMLIVDSVLKFLKAGLGAFNIDVKVYSIEYLFYILKEAACTQGEHPKPESHYITDAHFERDPYEYEGGISCHFHEEKDRTKYCAQSYVTRWGYTFANYICPDLAISQIPGRHCPLPAKQYAQIYGPQKKMASSRSNEMSSRFKDVNIKKEEDDDPFASTSGNTFADAASVSSSKNRHYFPAIKNRNIDTDDPFSPISASSYQYTPSASSSTNSHLFSANKNLGSEEEFPSLVGNAKRKSKK